MTFPSALIYGEAILPPLPKGQRSVATGVNDLPVAGQSRGVTEPQREEATEWQGDSRAQSARVLAVFRRRPMCRRVLHFTMQLINGNLNEDFELVGAQIFYNNQGRLR